MTKVGNCQGVVAKATSFSTVLRACEVELYMFTDGNSGERKRCVG